MIFFAEKTVCTYDKNVEESKNGPKIIFGGSLQSVLVFSEHEPN